jgi:hypothetical protein
LISNKGRFKGYEEILGVSLAVGAVGILAAVVVAQEHRHYGMGMGPSMGHAMMGGGPGTWPSDVTQITEQKANELAQQYADKYLAGFKVEHVLPSTGMPHTMYAVELKNATGELRNIHITPFGGVMPFGGPAGRS